MMKTFTILACIATVVLSTPVQGQIINAQIGTNLYTGAGADPLAGDNWDLVSTGSQTNFALTTDSSGNPLTGVSFTVSAQSFYGGFYGEANGNNLIDGYDYAFSPAAFSITGLAKDTAFTIYLYGTASNQAPGRTTTFTLAAANGGLSLTDTGRQAAEPSDTFVSGADYVVLTGTTDSTGTISGTYADPNTSYSEADFNGLQVNVAPEPTTCALMLAGLGLLALLPRLRRRSDEAEANFSIVG